MLAIMQLAAKVFRAVLVPMVDGSFALAARALPGAGFAAAGAHDNTPAVVARSSALART